MKSKSKSRRRALSREKLSAIARQRKANRSSQSEWEHYAGHRGQITRRLVADAAPTARLCLLGPGNCNDVDLEGLVHAYAEIHLVDLDAQAIEAARDRLSPELRQRVVLHGGVDLSGSIDKLPRWSKLAVTEAELLGHPSLVAQQLSTQLGSDFDRVASLCVYSQLQLAVLDGLGPEHRLFMAVTATSTLTHLRVLAALTRAGGVAHLFTELTSNTLFPPLSDAGPSQGPALFRAAIAEGRCITVCEPARLLGALHDDPVLMGLVNTQAPDSAWLWQQGAEQRFVVYELRLARRES